MKRILKVSLFVAVLFALIFGSIFLLFDNYTIVKCLNMTLEILGVAVLSCVLYYVFLWFALWCILD